MSGALIYSNEGSFAMLTGATGIVNNPVVAQTYQGQPVTEVSINAFSSNPTYLQGTLNLSNVTNVGDFAFSSCTHLSSVIMPNVATIGNGSFQLCRGLVGALDLSNVTTIKYQAFYGCSGLTGTLDLSNVTTLGGGVVVYGTFENCSGFTRLIYSPHVATIDTDTFKGCINLTGTFSLASNVFFGVGPNAFQDCNISRYDFINCPALGSIYSSAFNHTSGNPFIVLLNQFTYYSIVQSSFPSYVYFNLVNIGKWAAVGAGYNNNNTIAYSYDGVFWDGLGNILFQVTAYDIAWNGELYVAVGQGENSIAYSYDGRNWTGLGVDVFHQAYGIAFNEKLWVAVGTTVYNPNEPTYSIAYSSDGITWTLIQNGNLLVNGGVDVAWNGTIWVAVGYAGGNSGSFVAYSTDGLSWSPATVPSWSGDGLTSVAWNAKDNIWIAVGSGGCVSSSDGITWTLRTNPLPQSIGIAWSGSMWVVVGGIGTPSVNTIAYSYDGNTWHEVMGSDTLMFSVTTVDWNGSRWVAVGESESAQQNKTIMYSDNGMDWYVGGNNVFSNSASGVTWLYPTFVYMESTDHTYAILTGANGLINNGVVAQTYHNLPVTEVDTSAFIDLIYNLQGTLNLSNITYIQTEAFKGCADLTGPLDLSKVTSIGDRAFQNCSGFDGALTLSSLLTLIPNNAFDQCIKLTLPVSGLDLSNVTSIGAGAFNTCSNLNGLLTLSSSLTTIPSDAFKNCSGLTTPVPGLNLSNVTTIGSNAFYACNGMTGTLNLSNVISIGAGAFNLCYGINTLNLSTSLVSIGASAFEGCSGLSSLLTIRSPQLTTIGDLAFGFGTINTTYVDCSIHTFDLLACTSLTSINTTAFNRHAIQPVTVFVNQTTYNSITPNSFPSYVTFEVGFCNAIHEHSTNVYRHPGNLSITVQNLNDDSINVSDINVTFVYLGP